MTGWILLSGKERGGSDGHSIVTDEATTSGRQKPARRSAVGRGRRLRASIASDGLPYPSFGSLLLSRLPRPIPATSGTGAGPLGSAVRGRTDLFETVQPPACAGGRRSFGIQRNSATFSTWHGSCCWSGTRGISSSGRIKMAKFEAMAFAVGFVMTGFLTLVALPLA